MTDLKTQLSQADRDPLRDLPPEARLRAMHKKMPRRSWRGPLIGVGITIALHLVVVGVVWTRSREIQAPVTVFFPMLFPLADQKPAEAEPKVAPKPESVAPVVPAAESPEALK